MIELVIERMTPESMQEQYMVEQSNIANRCVVDIGANIGAFSVLCSNFGSDKIVAFEPDETNFQNLLQHIDLYPKINGYKLAVYDNSKKFIDMQDEENNAKVIFDKEGTEVPTITLENIVKFYLPKDKNDFVLKMDCEGSEYEILLSSSREDIRRFEYIFVEVHGTPVVDRNPQLLEEYLRFMGYEMLWQGYMYSQHSINGVLQEPEPMSHRIFKMKRI